MNHNEDFYNNNRMENSKLEFADMSMGNQYYTQGSGQSGFNQSYYPDWSQQGQFFNPAAQQNDPFSQNYDRMAAPGTGAAVPGATDYDQEPPLLEELGINFEHIFRKTKCVLNPLAKPHESIIHDEDLAGPLVFCIAYGFSLLLMGKIQFGYIYGITALGCLSMYSLLNLMSEKGVSAACIGSILGYCLLPMVILSFLSSFLSIDGYVSLIVSIFFIFWCSISSSKLFVNALSMSNQQILVLYPCFLLYGILALLNIF